MQGIIANRKLFTFDEKKLSNEELKTKDYLEHNEMIAKNSNNIQAICV